MEITLVWLISQGNVATCKLQPLSFWPELKTNQRPILFGPMNDPNIAWFLLKGTYDDFWVSYITTFTKNKFFSIGGVTASFYPR